jgi:hypothetical protein
MTIPEPISGPLSLDDFAYHLPSGKFVFLPTGGTWPKISIVARCGPAAPAEIMKRHTLTTGVIRKGSWSDRTGGQTA